MNTYHISKIKPKAGHKWTIEFKQEVLYNVLRMADMLDKNLGSETGLTEDAREILAKAAIIDET